MSLKNNIIPWVFICIYFVCNHGPSKSKLDLHTLKYVFIGYSNIKRGYKYYYPPSKRFFISKDVTFHENDDYYDKNTIKGKITHNVMEEKH